MRSVTYFYQPWIEHWAILPKTAFEKGPGVLNPWQVLLKITKRFWRSRKLTDVSHDIFKYMDDNFYAPGRMIGAYC